MDQATIDMFEAIRAGLEELGAVVDRAERRVEDMLRKIKVGDAELLAPLKGIAIGRKDQTDRGKLLTLFNLPPAHERFWADESRSLEVRPDGSFVVQFDKARMGEGGRNTGGSSWVNAWIPLPRAVAHARVSYTLVLDPLSKGVPVDFWGASMKLPGLGRWVEGAAPGGGEVTANNFSARPTVSDWNKDGKELMIGPYVYGQERAHQAKPTEIYAVDYPAGTLRWWGRLEPALAPKTGREIKVELEIGGGLVTLNTTAKGAGPLVQAWAMDLPPLIDGVPFCFMYGGDTPAYGPSVPVTEILVKDFLVEEIK